MNAQLNLRKIVLLVCLAGLSLGLAGCAGGPTRLWLNAPGWSRALRIGTTTASGGLEPAIGPDGEMYFLLIEQGDIQQHPVVAAYTPDGQVQWRVELDIPIGRAIGPKVRLVGSELRLLWVDDGTLFETRLDPQAGQLLAGPVSLSGSILADSFDVEVAQSGDRVVYFAGPRRAAGLYAVPPGANQPLTIDARGIKPDLVADPAGGLHLFWSHHPPGFGEVEFLFSRLLPSGELDSRANVIVRPPVGPTSVLQGPVGVVDGRTGYIFWSIIERTGMSAGSAQTRYVAFDPQAPSLIETAEWLYVPAEYHLTYEAVDAMPFQAGQRVALPAPSLPSSGYVADVAAASGSGEAAVAISSRSSYLRNKVELQASLMYLTDGAPQSYQLVSFTQVASTSPGLRHDGKGHLYLTWLEKQDVPGFVAYFTTTEPRMVAAMERMTSEDVARVGADAAFGLLTGALLAPAALAWIVLPLILLALTGRLRRENEQIYAPGTLVGLLLAIALFWLGKLALLPEIGDYIPFSAWIPFMPDWLEAPLRVGSPPLIGLLAAFVAWNFTYRRDTRSPVYFLLIYAGVDGLLTGALYGVLVYAAF
jgi:hypothetical protein